MKRRDLIKTGLATLGASTIALAGCSKNEEQLLDVDIIPKQTAKYEFSTPLPFDFKTIDEMAKLNSTIKKSQIKTLYNSLPQQLANKFHSWFYDAKEKGGYSIKTLDDFGQYVKYALDQGFEFTYLMESPRKCPEEKFLSLKDGFTRLLEYLRQIGVKDIEIGNNQTIEYVNECAPNEFNFRVSTRYDLRNILQYNNLFERYEGFNLIDMAYDEDRNFSLFKSLKKLYPDKKIEISLNEKYLKEFYNQKYSTSAFMKAVSIYPWNLEYYSLKGINNFKYVLHNQTRYEFSDISPVKLILEIIENGYENYTWGDLYEADWTYPFMINDKNRNIKLSDVVPLFPKVPYFIKNGDECDIKCKAQCNYCYECAEKLEKVLQLG